MIETSVVTVILFLIFDNVSEMPDKFGSYLETYRQAGFEKAIVTATKLTSELDSQPFFKP